MATIVAVGTAPVLLLPANNARVAARISAPSSPLFLSYGATAAASVGAPPWLKEGIDLHERDWKGSITAAANQAGFVTIWELS